MESSISGHLKAAAFLVFSVFVSVSLFSGGARDADEKKEVKTTEQSSGREMTGGYRPINLDDPLAVKAVSLWEDDFSSKYPDRTVPVVTEARIQVIAGYRIRLEWNDGQTHWGEVTLPVQGEPVVKIEIETDS